MSGKMRTLKCPKCGTVLYSWNGSIKLDGKTGIEAMKEAIRCRKCGCHPVEVKEK